MAGSKVAVYGAIAADIAIAVTKFIVAGITGSSAMLSEGVHSLVDTGNGVLLLVGLHRSRQPPTAEHPFGHGRELYFWSLIVAVLIFGLGGGVSIYEGVSHLREPAPLEDPKWSYIVLAAAALFEGTSFVIALREFRAGNGRWPSWAAVHESKDPSTYTVLAEDGAALVGLAIAAAGIGASHAWHMPRLDAVASLLIGLLLAGVAGVLVSEARGLLVGEGIRGETARTVRQLIAAHDAVRGVGTLRSMYIGADEVLLAIDVDLNGAATAEQVATTIRSIKDEIRGRYPKISRIYIEAQAADRIAQGAGG